MTPKPAPRKSFFFCFPNKLIRGLGPFAQPQLQLIPQWGVWAYIFFKYLFGLLECCPDKISAAENPLITFSTPAIPAKIFKNPDLYSGEAGGIRDQGPRITLGLGILKDQGQAFKKGSAVLVAHENFSTFYSPGHYVL